MAVNYLGYATASSNSQSSSVGLTIPDGATECILGIAYRATTEAGNLITAISLDGQAGELVRYITADPANRDNLVCYRFRGFTTGSSKLLSFTRSGAIYDGAIYMFVFTSGENATTPVKDSDEAVTTGTGQTLTTPNMDSSVNCLVILFAAGETTLPTVTGGSQTEIVTGSFNDTYAGMARKAGAGAADTATAVLTKGAIIGVIVNGDSGTGGGSNILLLKENKTGYKDIHKRGNKQ
jgi:hypothetical protein